VRPTIAKNAWNTFVAARYAGLVKAASAVVGNADAADAVLSALLRVAETHSPNGKDERFKSLMSAVTSVAANGRRVETHRGADALFKERAESDRVARGAAKPFHEVGSLVNAERLDRQVAVQLAVNANTKREVEAERIFNAETLAILARVRANRKVPQRS
jgi:hypothetical protein